MEEQYTVVKRKKSNTNSPPKSPRKQKKKGSGEETQSGKQGNANEQRKNGRSTMEVTKSRSESRDRYQHLARRRNIPDSFRRSSLVVLEEFVCSDDSESNIVWSLRQVEKFLAKCVRVAITHPRSPQTIYSVNGFVFLICLKKPNVDGIVGTGGRLGKHRTRQLDLASIPRFADLPLSGRNSTKSFVSQPLIFGAWNICTLQDKSDINRPERHTALVCRELARFSIDAAALSENRLPGEGSIRETGSKYTIFWKKNANEPRIHGVVLAINTFVSTAVSEHLMTVRILLIRDRYLISVYTPTLTSEDDVKGSFYNLLDRTIQTVHAHDISSRWGTLTAESAVTIV
uniref:Uncharacterized protein n=1 Tax=Octopus bimaculoides TaxID=37653 RepID=A0A0L8G4X2_OCTBM